MNEIGNILFIGEEKTYEFIEEMIKTMRRCFRSNKIHIGMDEAHMVGLGGYLEKHGYVNRFELLSSHLKRVTEITDKYGYSPMMWSDMFFRLGTKGGAYYDINPKLPDNISELIPEGTAQVYWDYYNTSEDMCRAMVCGHKKMNREIIFAGGIWTWSGPSLNYKQTFSNTIPALKVCKEQGIKNVFATMWGDDGAECDVFQALLGMQLFAEMNYCKKYCKAELEENFRACCALSADDFLLFDTENFEDMGKYMPEYIAEGDVITLSKQLLYQNSLLGLFDKNAELVDVKGHYKKLYEKLCQADIPEGFEELFKTQRRLVKVLMLKCDIGIRLKKAYDAKDKAALAGLREEFYTLADEISVLYENRKELWYKNDKPFGFEAVGGRLIQIKAYAYLAAERIKDFLDGKIEKIDELEQERLWYNSAENRFVHDYSSQRIMGV